MEIIKSNLLNDVQLIALLGIKARPSTIAASRTSGVLGGEEAPPHIKILGQPSYRASDIYKWLDRQKSKVTNAEHMALCA
ncbi:MAG: hypothetical protein RPT25_12275 [Cycloclasticus sp.]|jgi:hypothetical protein